MTRIPPRPAWIEINLTQLRRNLTIIRQDMPAGLKWCAVVKDQAYGHGAVRIAREALAAGAAYLAVATAGEGLELREHGIDSPILVFGERTREELACCLEQRLTCCINDQAQAQFLNDLARQREQRVPIHVEIDTGMSRYGVRWTHAAATIAGIQSLSNLEIEGVMTHFAMSDERDKTFANLQFSRYQQVMQAVEETLAPNALRHTCNTGGYLDLPHAHGDMVRMGILPLGVYPSQVCRRIPGIAPVMAVKARIAALQHIQPGDHVGYGMRYTAPSPRTVAVLPVGYGDGYPRVRNAGHVLVRGQRAPIIGGNAMDAMMVDVTEVAGVSQWDEVVLMGQQGEESISVHDLAKLAGTVSYDVLTKWSPRLPRIEV